MQSGESSENTSSASAAGTDNDDQAVKESVQCRVARLQQKLALTKKFQQQQQPQQQPQAPTRAPLAALKQQQQQQQQQQEPQQQVVPKARISKPPRASAPLVADNTAEEAFVMRSEKEGVGVRRRQSVLASRDVAVSKESRNEEYCQLNGETVKVVSASFANINATPASKVEVKCIKPTSSIVAENELFVENKDNTGYRKKPEAFDWTDAVGSVSRSTAVVNTSLTDNEEQQQLAVKTVVDVRDICKLYCGPDTASSACLGEIGFATLPDQVHRKSVKKGFDFTMMVCGESGLGKSTMINSLFLSELYGERKPVFVHEKLERTVEMTTKTIEIEEKGVKLRLTVVDTPGFGDSLNCEMHWKTIDDYLCSKFMEYYAAESGVNRKCIQDNRVHCCLYFIPPYGHGLREMDIDLMRRLQDRVNVIPIIAKADTLTRTEVNRLKARIRSDIQAHDIKVYQLPDVDSDEDELVKQEDAEIKAAWPFAVVASTQILEVHGQKIHGRLYPWGVVDVEDPEHSDFLKIRKMLIATHMQDLKEVTHDILYEQFRANLISSSMGSPAGSTAAGAATKPTKQHAPPIPSSAAPSSGSQSPPALPAKMHSSSAISNREAERDFATSFATDAALSRKDEELRRMEDMLKQMQEQLRLAGKEPSLSGMSTGSRLSRSSFDTDSVIDLRSVV